MGRDDRYLQLLLDPVRKCAEYRPKMGTKSGITLADFEAMRTADPFYSWFGLDNPLLYAAHKAAGGMTSIYRQIGIGGERLFREILQDELGLSEKQAKWSYRIPPQGGIGARTLALDARIDLEDLKNIKDQARIRNWIERAAARLNVDEKAIKTLKGVVFEIRQGYKSKDSKRQNADLANAATAYTKRYLPAIMLLSTQFDEDIAQRNQDNRWTILIGTTTGDDLNSTFTFMKDIIGYNLADFLRRNTRRLKSTVDEVLKALLALN